jgi:methylenetetrahydrofolate dehydrogenase (NADP+)/methenyltetrahydrofolate cyclohydrolase
MTNAEKRILMERYKSVIFDGNLLAQKVRAILKARIEAKASSMQKFSKPYLGYIIVGDLPQSELYVKLKLKACDQVGIGYHGFKLP